MNVVERAKAPTPKFFKVLRTVGLALSAVSQVTVDEDAKMEKELVKRLQEDNKNLPRDGIK
ncbi:hypothetical protein [Flavobacterium suncheonense]|uniref:Uncharacterized protein n=1 Tax=Flavobacterium suncheonense GH29-5 = DSM 17707 TaxID=1121899 RepID=A0A0A2MBZ2_9FLAO|nr:hypothetical protein [Flavobacterium suncheonense]KGO88983.1 hypothetical protein Q764_10275 [Flavobacterium suncheonense GH29-5 = DSM 17707]